MFCAKALVLAVLSICITSCNSGSGGNFDSDKISLLEKKIEKLESEIEELTSTTIVVFTTTTSESAVTTTTDVASSTTRSKPTAPQGGLIFNDCEKCGQSFPSGSCANWLISVTNSSDETVESFSFKPTRSYWREISAGFSGVEVEANSPARKIAINLPPYKSAEVQFQICTDTARPGLGWEYNNFAPRSIPFTWQSGARGKTCFSFGC